MIGDGRRRSPARSAPLTALCSADTGAADAAIFGEVVGGCGHTFVWDAGKETLGWSSLSLSLPPHHCTPPNAILHTCAQNMQMCCPGMHLYVQYIQLCVCPCLLLSERREEKEEEVEEERAGDAVAMESYPW